VVSVPRFAPVSALFVVACLVAGCTGAQSERQATQTRPQPLTTTVTVQAAPPPPTREVKLRVDSGSFGVFAFARVFIGGKGPFTFTVDTGASHSVIDFDLVRKLRIRTIGAPLTVTGITCRGQAARIRVSHWRVGRVALPAREIQTIDMPDPGGGVDGLLGSDILSTFGAVTVDYAGERLVLPSAT
jgi:predicted aspartyl protease